jgi:4'-phosphopantetheinyl transferase
MPTAPEALARVVDVWWLPLESAERERAALWRLLSPDERERADRFRDRRDRERFTIRRGRLRQLLGRRLGLAPERVRFAYGAWGKPTLAGPYPSAASIQFSLSHTGDTAVIAVAATRLGVDVERVREDLPFAELASRHFAPVEVATLSTTADARRAEGFFRSWTRHEALLKGFGSGWSADGRGSSAPKAPKRRGWCVRGIPTPPGYVAAVAVETRRPVSLRRLEWCRDFERLGRIGGLATS